MRSNQQGYMMYMGFLFPLQKTGGVPNCGYPHWGRLYIPLDVKYGRPCSFVTGYRTTWRWEASTKASCNVRQ